MKMRITKTLALLAAFCGLQLFTATTAQAAVSSGTKVVSYSGKTLPQYTLEDSGIYDYTYGAFNERGILEMSFSLNYNGQTTSDVQGIFHAGQDGTGFSIKQTTGSGLIFSIKNETGTSYQISGNLVTGDNTVVCRFEGTGDGTANASVTLNGTRYDLGSWTFASMNWNSSASERNKYSMGNRAPGWNERPLTTSTIANNTITATYMAPVNARVMSFNVCQGDTGKITTDQTTLVGTIPSAKWIQADGVNTEKTGTLIYNPSTGVETTASANVKFKAFCSQ